MKYIIFRQNVLYPFLKLLILQQNCPLTTRHIWAAIRNGRNNEGCMHKYQRQYNCFRQVFEIVHDVDV